MAETTKKHVTPAVALKSFFGMKEGQTLQGFLAEIKELSEEERLNLAKLVCEEMGWELEVKSVS